jgi:hypothetical protein
MYLVHPRGSIWFYNFLAWTARPPFDRGGRRGCNQLLRPRLHHLEAVVLATRPAVTLSRPPPTHWDDGMSMRQ